MIRRRLSGCVPQCLVGGWVDCRGAGGSVRLELADSSQLFRGLCGRDALLQRHPLDSCRPADRPTGLEQPLVAVLHPGAQRDRLRECRSCPAEAVVAGRPDVQCRSDVCWWWCVIVVLLMLHRHCCDCHGKLLLVLLLLLLLFPPLSPPVCALQTLLTVSDTPYVAIESVGEYILQAGNTGVSIESDDIAMDQWLLVRAKIQTPLGFIWWRNMNSQLVEFELRDVRGEETGGGRLCVLGCFLSRSHSIWIGLDWIGLGRNRAGPDHL